MKKFNTRSILFILLLAASVSSYVFLVSHSDDSAESYSRSLSTEEVLDVDESEFALPEVMFVKHVIDIGKRLVSFTR